MVVVGSSNTDLVVNVPELPRPGQTVLGGTYFHAAGGKGANQAVAASRAGAHVRFVGAVGDDEFGRRSLDGLRREGIDVESVRVVPGVASGVALIMVDARGENLIAVAPGANAHLDAEQVRQASAAWIGASVMLVQLEIPLPAVVQAVRLARDRGLRVVLNPAPSNRDIMTSGLLEHVDVLVPNQHEAGLLTGMDVGSRHGCAGAARAIQSCGCHSVVITMGGQGCLVVDQEAAHVPAFAVKAVDAVGAGDAFCGVLAVALAEGESLAQAAELASRAGALSTTRHGAQPSMPRRAEIDSLDRPDAHQAGGRGGAT